MIGGMLLGPVVALALGNLGVDDGLEMWAGLPWLRVGVAGLLVGLGSRVSFSPFQKDVDAYKLARIRMYEWSFPLWCF
jgi:hypothetical protein